MTVKLKLSPEIYQDVASGYDWYEEKRSGLGEEFLSCVDACIESICRNPKIYQTVYKGYRRGIVRRFPYVIFYEYSDDIVTLYGIYHTSQDPEKWRTRLQ